MEHAQAQPPVFVEAGHRLAADPFSRQPVTADLQLAVDERTNLIVGGLVAAVQLRTIPPVGVVIAEGRRLAGICTSTGRVGLGTAHRHAPRPQRIAGRQREADRIGLGVRAMVEPVVHHELDPGGGNEVEAGRRLELAARHQAITHIARVRAQQRGGFAMRRLQRHVAAKTPVHRAFGRVRQDVAGAVFGPRRLAAGIARYVGVMDGVILDIQKVVLEQGFAFDSQRDQSRSYPQRSQFGQSRPGHPNRHMFHLPFFIVVRTRLAPSKIGPGKVREIPAGRPLPREGQEQVAASRRSGDGRYTHAENGFGAIGHVQLRIDVFQVPLGGGQRDTGSGADLCIAQSVQQAFEDFHFPVGQQAGEARGGHALRRLRGSQELGVQLLVTLGNFQNAGAHQAEDAFTEPWRLIEHRTGDSGHTVFFNQAQQSRSLRVLIEVLGIEHQQVGVDDQRPTTHLALAQ
ncbi:hypothetical protein D3C77_404970 [compost metagenome]